MLHPPESWKADYERDGYLVVEELVDAEALGRLRDAVERITRDSDALPPNLRQWVQLERDYFEDQPEYNRDMDAARIGNAVRNIMEIPLFDPVFAELIRHDPLLDVLEVLFDSCDFHFHNYKCIIKAPRVSSSFRWHRDLPYLQHSSPNLITAMLCLDGMTEENGATVVLPSSHRIAHEDVKDSDVEMFDEDLPPGFERKMVCCPPGSAVLFHVNIIHGGPANRSDIPRRNLIGIWAGPGAYPVTSARYAYHGLYPRSRDPDRQAQVQQTFARLAVPAATA
jgi:ectoine hydroxylase-related dioxygenase (phytanoyl-CoA dioxygenase family)